MSASLILALRRTCRATPAVKSAIGECKAVERDEIIVCTQSCGPVGPGGWTGCMVEAWKGERDRTQWGKNVPRKR